MFQLSIFVVYLSFITFIPGMYRGVNLWCGTQQVSCRTTLWNLKVQLYNVSFIHVALCCIRLSWTYLHKQQMSELPFMTVCQVLSLLEPFYER